MLKKEVIELLIEDVEVEEVYFVNKYGLASGVAYDMIVNININGVLHELKAHAMAQSWALVGHLRPNLHGDNYKGANKREYKHNIKAYWQSPVKGALKEYFNRFTKKDLINLYIYYYYNSK